MKNFSYLKALLLAAGLLFGVQTASAQIATLADKQAHQNTLPENYDQWKRSVTRGNEAGPNLLITTSTNGGFSTHTIQMGYNITDQAHADLIVNKLQAQPGVSNVSADHATNRVVYTVKEEDEHNSLSTYFDIQ